VLVELREQRGDRVEVPWARQGEALGAEQHP
jgi:hypothetical protein